MVSLSLYKRGVGQTAAQGSATKSFMVTSLSPTQEPGRTHRTKPAELPRDAGRAHGTRERAPEGRHGKGGLSSDAADVAKDTRPC